VRKAFFRSLLRPNREYSCSYEVSAIQFGDIESGAGEILIRGGAGTAVVLLYGFTQELRCRAAALRNRRDTSRSQEAKGKRPLIRGENT